MLLLRAVDAARMHMPQQIYVRGASAPVCCRAYGRCGMPQPPQPAHKEDFMFLRLYFFYFSFAVYDAEPLMVSSLYYFHAMADASSRVAARSSR